MKPSFILTTLVALVLALAAPGAQAADNAVIIQGWLPAQARGLDWVPESVDTSDELWNDSYLAFEVFCARPSIDTNPDRIHMLWGEGRDSDRKGLRYDPLGHLGLWTITDSIADIPHISRCLQSLAPDMGPTDTLFCYTWGHGGLDRQNPRRAKHSSIKVQPVHWENGGYTGTPLWDTAFARMCDPVLGRRVYIMQQCYGGGFIDDLNDDRTTMICAALATDKARSCDNESQNGSPLPEHEVYQGQTYRHCEFNFHFMNALRGRAIWGSSYNDPPAVVADTNGDGIVSWYEAFRYEQEHNSRWEEPMYCDPTAYSWNMQPIPPGGGVIPKPIKEGAALAVLEPDSGDNSGISLWALKGNVTCEFWKYDVRADSWISRQDIPFCGQKPEAGATLTAGSRGKLYATKGGGTLQFWQYDTTTESWSQLPDVGGLKKVRAGASAAYVEVGGVPYVYLLKGSSYEFCRYNISTACWEMLPPAPPGLHSLEYKDGSAIVYDGDSTIYALKGCRNEFYAYRIGSGTWETRPALPLDGHGGHVKAGEGAGLAMCGDRVYVMKGNNSRELWAYNCRTNSWLQTKDDVPSAPSGKSVRWGGGIAEGGGLLWILKGNKTYDFCRFAPNRCFDSTEAPVPPTPGPIEFCLVAAADDAGGVRWSNSGECVAFTAPDSSGHYQVFKVPAAGGPATRLTQVSGDCARPVWSPEDTSIAFEVTLDASSYSQLAVVPAGGGPAAYLTSSPWDHRHVTWSPAGTIGFLRDDSTGFSQVYTLLSTGEELALTQDAVEHASPEFVTPTQLVFTREGGNGYTQVYQTTAGTPDATPLTSSAMEHANPVPALGAGLVFFEVDGADGFAQIAKAPLEGGPEMILTGGPYDFESPTVDNNASAIYCTRSSGPGSALCQVNPMGGYVELTDELAKRVAPHVHSDGFVSPSVAYVRDGDVFRLTEDGSGQQSASSTPIPKKPALSACRPNPFRDRTQINYQLPTAGNVSLRVYDVTGRTVRTLASGFQKPGAYSVTWDSRDSRGRQVAHGVYFYRLDTPGFRDVKKAVVTR